MEKRGMRLHYLSLFLPLLCVIPLRRADQSEGSPSLTKDSHVDHPEGFVGNSDHRNEKRQQPHSNSELSRQMVIGGRLSKDGLQSHDLQSRGRSVKGGEDGESSDTVSQAEQNERPTLFVVSEHDLGDSAVNPSLGPQHSSQPNTFNQVKYDSDVQSDMAGDSAVSSYSQDNHIVEHQVNDGNADYPETVFRDGVLIPTWTLVDSHAGDLESSYDISTYVDFSPPIDYFRCGPCTCHQLINSSFSSANCKRHNPKLQDIPQSLPKRTVNLNIAVNNIRRLSFSSLSVYESLQVVNLSSNRITRIPNGTCNMTLRIRDLDLSDNKIVSIDEGSFLCTPALTRLNLHQNQLQVLAGSFFLGLTALRHLDVSRNHINDMQVDAFYNCNRLKTLRLDNNKRLTYGKKVLKAGLFTPLKELEVLYIQGWQSALYYPLKSLLELPSLRVLNIDGLTKGFDSTMANFTKLSTLLLSVGGNCRTKFLTDSYFQGIPNLRSLHIEGCVLDKISPGAFQSNPLLEDFSLVDIYYDFDSVFESLQGLQDKPIKKLTLNHIRLGMKDVPCRFLGSDHVKYIQNMTHLQELNLEFNMISMISRIFIYKLPHNITSINVRKNMLSYLRSILRFKQTLESVQNLVTLQEDMQNQVVFFPSEESPSCAINRPLQPEGQLDLSDNSGKRSTFDQAELSTDVLQDLDSSHNRSHPSVGYDIPGKLQFYSASGSFHFGQAFLSPNRTPKNNVHVLNISHSFYTDFGTKTLSRWLKVADLSYNFCDFMSNSFFKINNSLEVLYLAGNFFSDVFNDDLNGEKLGRLSRLRYLDISRNRLRSLPRQFFRGLTSVQTLDLSRNSLETIDFELSHMEDLRFVNLKQNSVRWISQSTRDQLDNLSASHSPVSIDLTSNPIPCTCEGLELLKWMATTNVRLISQDFLVCHNKDQKPYPLANLEQTVQALQRSCSSKAYLILTASFSIVIVLMVLATVWAFRNRWWIYYIKNIIITKIYGYKPDKKDQQYLFDAYILYSKNDTRFVLKDCIEELEVKRGHRVCVEHRDFLVGCIMSTTITSAITNSKITLAVVSPGFWEGEWCEYGIQMATMEALHTKRKVLHLLIHKPVPLEKMPRILLKVHQDNEFTEYPPPGCGPEVRKAFWDAVSVKIGHVPRHVEEELQEVET